jgi:cytochrome c2
MFQINRRFRFVISALVALFVAALLSTVVIAGSLKGSETKGRNYFRGSCKECHTKGAKGARLRR